MGAASVGDSFIWMRCWPAERTDRTAEAGVCLRFTCEQAGFPAGGIIFRRLNLLHVPQHHTRASINRGLRSSARPPSLSGYSACWRPQWLMTAIPERVSAAMPPPRSEEGHPLLGEQSWRLCVSAESGWWILAFPRGLLATATPKSISDRGHNDIYLWEVITEDAASMWVEFPLALMANMIIC